MSRAQVVGDVMHRLGGQPAKDARVHSYEAITAGVEGGDTLVTEGAVLGGVLAEGQKIGMHEVWQGGLDVAGWPAGGVQACSR
jgi:hypothetical protein